MALPCRIGGTGTSGLMRGLATLPQGGSRSLQWSETVMEDPKSFKIGLAVLIQYRHVTDRQPATEPRHRSIYCAYYGSWVKMEQQSELSTSESATARQQHSICKICSKIVTKRLEDLGWPSYWT